MSFSNRGHFGFLVGNLRNFSVFLLSLARPICGFQIAVKQPSNRLTVSQRRLLIHFVLCYESVSGVRRSRGVSCGAAIGRPQAMGADLAAEKSSAGASLSRKLQSIAIKSLGYAAI